MSLEYHMGGYSVLARVCTKYSLPGKAPFFLYFVMYILTVILLTFSEHFTYATKQQRSCFINLIILINFSLRLKFKHNEHLTLKKRPNLQLSRQRAEVSIRALRFVLLSS